MKKYYLRTSAGGKLGWGNLYRILIIYNFLKKNKKNVCLHIKGNKDIYNFLKKKKINYLKIKSNNLRQENKILYEKGIADISILEVLNPTLGLQAIYKKNSKKLVVLDDLLNQKYDCDILFCCQTIRKKNIINIKKTYNSYKFFPLKENFNPFIKRKKKISKNLSKITVFLGGGNYYKSNISVAKTLNKFNLDVIFLIGNENSNNIIKKLKSINKNFKILIDYKDIPKIIFASDLVICGGGYTKIEVAYLKTPLIPLCLQQHQNVITENFKYYFDVDYIKYKKLNFSNLSKLVSKMSYSERKKISNKFSRYFSLNGIDRIMNKIMN